MNLPSLQELRLRWEATPRNRRLLFCVISLAGTALILLLLLLGAEDEYCRLCDDIDDKASVVAIAEDLEKAGIDHRIAHGGRRIDVRRSQLPEALTLVVSRRRVAPRDSGTGLFTGGIIQSSTSVMNSETRRREEELAATISMCDGVRLAKVMITPADNRLFSRKHKEARASVFLQLAGGKSLSPCQVMAIRDIVANGVQGLRKENITIADSGGTDYAALLVRHRSRWTAERIELQEKLEEFIAQKIRNHLAVMFGRGNVDVAVTACLDVERLEQGVRSAEASQAAPASGGAGVRMVSLSTAGEMLLPPGRGEGRKGRRRSAGGSRPLRGTSVMDAVSSLCIAVFVDSSLFQDGEMPEGLRKAVFENVRTVARLDERRGDRVSIQAVPFRHGPASLAAGSKVSSTVDDTGPGGAVAPRDAGATEPRSAYPALVVLLVLAAAVFAFRSIIRARSGRAVLGGDVLGVDAFLQASLDGGGRAFPAAGGDWDGSSGFDGESVHEQEELLRATAEHDPELIARLIRAMRAGDRDDA